MQNPPDNQLSRVPPPPAVPAGGVLVGRPPYNTLAVVSLVAGIAAYVVLPFVAALVAIITGHMARRQIRQTGEQGAGMALAGMILGYVHMALLVIVILFILLVVAVGLGIATQTTR